MPKIQISVPHQLEREVAVERLRSFSDKFRAKFGSQISSIEESWSEESMEFSITARGMKLRGRVEVTPTMVEVESNLPFAALPFRGLIESNIRDAINSALA